MKQKCFQRISMFAMALLMILTLIPTALAANEATIIPGKTGSLTLYKYDGDPIGNDEYLSQKEMADLIAENGDSLTPLEGVVFAYLKVGGVKQYTKNEGETGNVTKIGYSVDEALTTFLGLQDSDVDYTDKGTNTKYYTTKKLMEKLAAKSQTELEQFMQTNSAKAMPSTDKTGKTTVANLEQGLYLVVEKTYPAGTILTTEPFFVSIPMTDKMEDGSFSWIYDVTAYPKNKVEKPTIDKSVVEDGDESKDIDGEIGQSKTFRIRADVPMNIGKLNKYKITDTLSTGLTFDNAIVPKVYGIKADGTRELLTANKEYKFSQSGQKLTFTFTPVELADTTSKLAEYIRVEIDYNAIINENAVVGDPSNPNDVELEYSNNTNVNPGDPADTTETTKPTDMPAIYTYAVNLLKYGDSDTDNPLANVTFELYRAGNPDNGIDSATKLNVTKGVDGTYYLEEDGGDTLTTSDTGKLYVKGLERGKYYLKEIATNAGYNLLADPIELTITSNEGSYTENEAGTFAPVDTSKIYYTDAAKTEKFVLPEGAKTGDYVNFGTNLVYTDEGKVSMYIQDELEWSCNYSMGAENGEISLNVNNVKGFELPRTGGSGTIWFIVIGGALVAMAAIVIVIAAKKKKNTAETK